MIDRYAAYQWLKFDRPAERVLRLTLDEPGKLNAIDAQAHDELAYVWNDIDKDPDTSCVVLTGAGGAFCSGGDVKGFADRASSNDVEENYECKVHDLRQRMDISRVLHEMPKPTLAVIPGPAAGAGLSLALACDLRIVAQDAKLTTAFSRVGLSGDFGGSYFLTRLVGTARARELYFTSTVLKAHEATELGIVNRVVSDDNLLEETMKLATQMANGPRIALAYMKKNLNAAETGKLSDVFELEAWHHTRCGMTEDHKEAAQAFVDKRQPTFKGR